MPVQRDPISPMRMDVLAPDLGDHINRRVLETECLAHDCGLAPAQLADVVQPTQTPEGLPAPAF